MAFSRVLACAVVLSIPSLALAQAPPEPPPPTHEETFEAAYVGVSGNASTSTVGLGADFISRPDSWLFRNRVKFVRNESNDELTASAFDFASRTEKALSARVSLFAEYGFFRDRFAGVDDRNDINGGVALKVVRTPRQTLDVDLGLGYINEQRITGDSISKGDYLLGAGYKLKLSENAEITDDFRMTGIVSQGDNWRLEQTISLTTKIAAGFSLKVSNGIRYANFPPPGFKKTDSVTSVALVAKFAQP
jgi:putative salt-induced outer membrane protein YdiY